MLSVWRHGPLECKTVVVGMILPPVVGGDSKGNWYWADQKHLGHWKIREDCTISQSCVLCENASIRSTFQVYTRIAPHPRGEWRMIGLSISNPSSASTPQFNLKIQFPYFLFFSLKYTHVFPWIDWLMLPPLYLGALPSYMVGIEEDIINSLHVFTQSSWNRKILSWLTALFARRSSFSLDVLWTSVGDTGQC